MFIITWYVIPTIHSQHSMTQCTRSSKRIMKSFQRTQVRESLCGKSLFFCDEKLNTGEIIPLEACKSGVDHGAVTMVS